MNFESMLMLVLAVATLVPALGGGLGAIVGAFVDLLKALRLLPDGWGGRVTVLANLVVFVAIYALIGQSPLTVELPPDVSAAVSTVLVYLKIITRVVGNLPPEAIPVLLSIPVGIYHYVSQLGGSLAFHKVLKLFVPTDVSHTARKVALNAG